MRALELLNFLSALDDEGNLTALGSVMAEFPLDPQVRLRLPSQRGVLANFDLARKMLIVSPEFKCSNEILTITLCFPVSVPFVYLSFTELTELLVPNVWIRPPNARSQADAAKALLTVPDGDHLTMLNVYNQYVQSMLLLFLKDKTLT